MQHLDRKTPPQVSSFGHLSVPSIRVMTLDNGLPLKVIDHGSQDVCRLTCVWDGGIAESPSISLPTMTLSLMQEGTRHHSGVEIADRIEFNVNCRGIGPIYWDDTNSVSQNFYTLL
uniref:hypothetical protein n=1 Tax=uncultured Muribaculum sp. TaxID=1918613 RepID=UPI0025B706E5